MEWMNRGGEQPAANQPTHTGGTHSKKLRGMGGMNLRVVSVALLFCATIVAVGVIGLIAFAKPSQESKYVQGDKLQAVFLNGGQVYFGNINQLNDDYLKMSNIYYLRVNQVVQPDQKNPDGTQATQNDISLVKLGCELHGPTDEMLINRDMVIFWENLKDDGQVANAVKDYVAKNPNGQDCNAQAQQQDTNTVPTTNPEQ